MAARDCKNYIKDKSISVNIFCSLNQVMTPLRNLSTGVATVASTPAPILECHIKGKGKEGARNFQACYAHSIGV